MQIANVRALRAVLPLCLLAATVACGKGVHLKMNGIDRSANAGTAGRDGSGADSGHQRPSSVTLSWTPPLENVDGTTLQDLAGYKIYSGPAHNDLELRTMLHNPGLARYVIEPLAPHEICFAITAVNSKGSESARTAVVFLPTS
jgi:hypothetical protein